MENPLIHLASESFCYFTTTGRRTGRLHTIEIWFALNGTTLYMLSDGGQADWVKNARKTPQVSVKIGNHTFSGLARDVTDPTEDVLVRRILHAKYSSAEYNLDDWAATALPFAVDLQV